MSTAIVSEKSDAVTRLLFNAGPCGICLLEGAYDVHVFSQLWFKHTAGMVYFHNCGSKNQVQALASTLLELNTRHTVRGIVDRDFLTLAQRDASMQNLPIIHISYKHELENYFVTFNSVDKARFIANNDNNTPNLKTAQALIDELHESLAFVCAANALLTENDKPQLPNGFDCSKHHDIIRKVSEQLALSEDQAQKDIATKQMQLRECHSWPHNAIEGKRLVHELRKRLSAGSLESFTLQLASHSEVPSEFTDWLGSLL
jgi:hypothetical protein